MKRYKGRWRI